MKKLIVKFKKDIKENWPFYIFEVIFLLFFELVILKIEPIKAVLITFAILFGSLVLFVIFGLKDLYNKSF